MVTRPPQLIELANRVVTSFMGSKTLRDTLISDVLAAQFRGQCPSDIAGSGALHKLAKKEAHPFRGIASGPDDVR